jgi:hypothetical protein
MDNHTHTGLEFIAGLGKASTCNGYGVHRPIPLRFVWHHILPQACGGQTVAANLVSLCDSCHYSIHIVLWQMANKLPLAKTAIKQVALAKQGYDLAVAAGTVDKIPKEGAGG